MAIETLFPLAIYYEELFEAETHREGLVKAVLELEESGFERRNYPEMAWTGDIHGVQQIHLDQRFAWVVGQVEMQTMLYLQELGVDLTQVDLYIQRSWPIVCRPGQEVGAHCHNTAHISAVYYIVVPEGEADPGSLIFLDGLRVNEVCPGLGSENTDILTEINLFNQLEAAYPPVEGRIIIFPAKQRHAVSSNESEDLRISLSFDIILTAKPGMAAGSHEFLTPPPSQWQAFQTPMV
jgi:uncharacterized protein (TIGR02466 family)